MKKLQYNIWMIVLLFATVSFNYSKSGTPEEIRIISYAPVQPVLKGMLLNPLLRITVYVPEGNSVVNYRKINCTLNATAVNDIQKLEAWFTDTEPLFAAVNAIASFTPSTTGFGIPVDIRLKPGMHHIWISAVLKPTANIDNKIELHCTALVNEANEISRVKETGYSLTKKAGVALRKAGDDGVNTYRIPGITTTDKGTLIAVYDVRYNNDRDLPGNIDVGMSRSVDGGRSWQPMKIIMDMGGPQENSGCGDPAILFDPVAKKIWVAALWSKGNRSIAGSEPGLSPDTTGQFVLVSSDDDGLTWSPPYNITAQVKDPAWHLYFQGPGNGMAMQNGTLVFPSQYWDESKKPGLPHSSIIYSGDHGKTWKSGTGAKPNTTESQVVETTPGTLMLNMRDNRGSFRSVATTTNLGSSWVEHFTSYNALPDPVCMGSLIKAKVKVKGVIKEVLFFSNPAVPGGRYNMTIKASLDLGKTWLAPNQLMVDERRGYGYSALTKIDDHTIGILYEGTRDLYFVRVPVSDIIK